MKLIFAGLLASLAVTASADTLKIVCQEGENKVVLTQNLSEDRQMISIYNQGGLGPDFLDSSYVGRAEKEKSFDLNVVTVASAYAKSGELQVSFEKSAFENGVGTIVYPGSNKEFRLEACTYSVE